MQCGAVAHGHNDPATETFRSYDCPLINAGAASDELKGSFANADAQLSVERLQPGAGPCNRR